MQLTSNFLTLKPEIKTLISQLQSPTSLTDLLDSIDDANKDAVNINAYDNPMYLGCTKLLYNRGHDEAFLYCPGTQPSIEYDYDQKIVDFLNLVSTDHVYYFNSDGSVATEGTHTYQVVIPAIIASTNKYIICTNDAGSSTGFLASNGKVSFSFRGAVQPYFTGELKLGYSIVTNVSEITNAAVDRVSRFFVSR